MEVQKPFIWFAVDMISANTSAEGVKQANVRLPKSQNEIIVWQTSLMADKYAYFAIVRRFGWYFTG